MLKRFFAAFIAVLAVFFFSRVPSFAAEPEAKGSEVEDALPESVREYGLTYEKVSDFLELKSVFSLLFSAVAAAFSKALVPFLTAVVFLVALFLLKGLLPERENPLIKTLCAVFAFGSVAAAFVPVFDSSSALRTAIGDVCAFGQSLFSVLLSCVAASGRTAAAAAASAGTGVLFSALSFVGTEIAVPCVNTFFAVGVTSSVLSDGFLYSLSKTLKKVCVSVLGVCSLVFSLAMGARQLLASSADNVSVRAAAYAVGNGIPVVGGSIGESMSAVIASAEAVAKNVGVFGAVAVVLILFSPLVSVFVLRFLSAVLCAVSEMFGLDSMRRFFSVVGDAYSLVCALAASVGVLVIIGIGLVM